MAVRFPTLLKVEKEVLTYSLYIAKIRIDDDDFPSLFAYEKNEQQARDNMQSMFSPEDWNRVEIISITPYPEGFQLSESIHLEGMINDTFYHAYLPTIRKIRLPRIYDSEDTLDIFADILQRIISAGAIVGVNTTMEMNEYIEEDEEGKEVEVHEAGPAEVYFRIWKKIEVDNEMGVFLIADEGPSHRRCG